MLRPGGKAFYFYEPATPRYLYAAAFYRANRKRPEVPEDVLISAKLAELADEAGLELKTTHYPSARQGGGVETIYYLMLSRWSFLRRLLPCTSNFMLTKRGSPRLA